MRGRACFRRAMVIASYYKHSRLCYKVAYRGQKITFSLYSPDQVTGQNSGLSVPLSLSSLREVELCGVSAQ